MAAWRNRVFESFSNNRSDGEFTSFYQNIAASKVRKESDMSTLQPDEGDVSERELLVDDIQRIREALRVTADAVNKLSSEDEEDDEEDDEEFEEEEEEENEQPCAENASLKRMFHLLFW